MEKPLKKTVHYYPFGLKMKGFNDATTALGNDIAQKFKYNGVELEESLGLNLYEMDFRLYDPAIARFNGIDPVTHFNQGTSVAFDNNPIYWADPSGADAVTEHIAAPTCYTCNNNGLGSGRIGDFGFEADNKPKSHGWKPTVNENGEVIYEAQEGATADSFVKQYGKINGIDRGLAMALIRLGKGNIRGNDVKALIGTDILKISPRNTRSFHQDIFNQMLFAYDLSRARGHDSFSVSDYFVSFNFSQTFTVTNVEFEYEGEIHQVKTFTFMTQKDVNNGNFSLGNEFKFKDGDFVRNVNIMQTGPKTTHELEVGYFILKTQSSYVLRKRLQRVVKPTIEFKD